MKTNIIIKLQLEGIHRWSNCPFEEVSYLKNYHRHIFFITMEKQVTHSDRDIEIIMFKHKVQQFLKYNYGNANNVLNLGDKSCEMLCEELLRTFDCKKVEVLEDNENGAVVII